MNAVSKALFVSAQLVALVLLCVIAYNTGVGKTLPVNHPKWMSCDGVLSQALFYGTLLEQSDALKDLAPRVKNARTVADINQLVSDGSAIDAARTQWFESVSEPGRCQAQVFLQRPNGEGNNTAYIGFDVRGFAQSDRSFLESLEGGEVLESVNLDIMGGIKWFKE
ncbi:MAG: hypothetical protein WA747_06035 [Steroidobacteraceae bacterium]